MLLTFTLAAALAGPADPVNLSAPAATPLVTGDSKDDIGETVRIVTRDKVALSASYFAPRAKRNSKSPAAILVHDAGSDRSTLMGMALYLQRKGFGVLTLDLRGHGDSATDEQSWAEMDQGARESAWAFASRDLEAAASYLLGRSEIHAANLSLIGVGHGAGPVLRHAMEDQAARAVVLVAPPEEAQGFDVAGGVADLEGLPCLIVAPKEARKLAEGMQASGHEANDGYEFIAVQVMKTSADELLADKRLNSSFARWLSGEVIEKDG